MPLRLVDLTTTEPRAVTLAYGAGDLTARYDAEALTTEVYEALTSGEISDLARSVAGLLVEWDLLGDDDAPLPIDEETLRGLPLKFLSAVLQAIVADMQPGEASGATSVAGSSPAASTAPARTGTRPSARRATSGSRRGS